MSDWLPELRVGYDRAAIRTIWVAFALSLLIHLAVLWPWLPRAHFLSLENPARGNASGPLIVELAPRPSRKVSPPPAPPPAIASPPSPPAPIVKAPPAPAKRPPTPKATPRPPSSPPVLARKPPAPAVVPPPSNSPPVAEAPPTIEGDLSSYIEARRRARSEARPYAPPVESSNTPPVEDERERHNRIVAANLGLLRTPEFGHDPEAGGGIFQVQRMGFDDAEFIFFGWNKDIRRNSRQLIQVQRGDNSDIRIAVIRKMIAIIRENESGDFVWQSKRLGRDVTLSARPGDNAGLEDFLMRDMFGSSG
jgi:hypothetical protein